VNGEGRGMDEEEVEGRELGIWEWNFEDIFVHSLV